MSLLNVPKEALKDYLFPFLHVNDILRLRRVHQFTKNVADNYLRVFGHHLLGEIIIDEVNPATKRTFEDFMSTGFSVSKIHLKIDNPSSLGSEGALDFMEAHGSNIKALRVTNMYCCDTQEEFKFYQALTNLVSLEIHTVDTVERPNSRHPTSFCETLKKLAIDEVIFLPTDQNLRGQRFFFRNVRQYVTTLDRLCHRTEYVKEPCYRFMGSQANEGNFGVILGVAANGRLRRAEPSTTYYYDVSGYKHSELTFNPTILTAICCDNPGFLRLVGVDTNYFLEMDHLQLHDFETIGLHLLSITNVSYLMLQILDAPHLEEIDIYSTARCSTRYAVLGHNRWPKLKKLSMCVDSIIVQGGESVKDLFDQFFGENITNQNLEELALLFEDALVDTTYIWPAVESIISSCPNVKKLKLKGWPGTNEELCQLWAGLEHLEQVCLEDCVELGDDVFVGRDMENPVFLNLKNLRKLELRKVDRMPQIMDGVFEHVFRHTKLTHFIIQSDQPIQNVTPTGIRSLLTDDFANSIAKFPFQGWSLADVSEESFKELGAAFRSSYMV